MLCERCHKKEACLHATKIENHEVKHLHLCEDCARAAGFDMETGMVNLQKLAQRWGAALAGRGAGREAGRGEAAEGGMGVCPQCGMEADELEGGRPLAGCPRCYEVFPEVLQGRLREMQEGLRVPVEWASEADERREALAATAASASLLRGLPDEATGEDPAFAARGVPERSGTGAAARPGPAGGSAGSGGASDGNAEGAERNGAAHPEGRRGSVRRSGARSVREERRHLEAALEEAVRAERYEEAVRLRDRLKALEGGTE